MTKGSDFIEKLHIVPLTLNYCAMQQLSTTLRANCMLYKNYTTHEAVYVKRQINKKYLHLILVHHFKAALLAPQSYLKVLRSTFIHESQGLSVNTATIQGKTIKREKKKKNQTTFPRGLLGN